MLCEKCQSIHFRLLRDCEQIRQEPERLLDYADNQSIVVYFHHKTKVDLKASADNGCHFCAMLWVYLLSSASISMAPTYARGEVVLVRSIIDTWIARQGGLDDWNKHDWIYISCEGKRVTSTIYSESYYDHIESAMLAALTDSASLPISNSAQSPPVAPLEVANIPRHALLTRIFDSEHNPYSPSYDTSTRSPANLVLASYWLNNCLSKHQPCSEAHIKPRDMTLPTRLINVANPHKPFLVLGREVCDPYVTLSYKWGSSGRYVTTTKNLCQHEDAIVLGKLPLTFRDAIDVTKILGFDYLWIDALCIVQDSVEDKIGEINAMDRIFSCSTLTLFAAAGDNAEAGLGVERDPRVVKPCRLNFKTTLDGKTVAGTSYITLDGLHSDCTSEPLFRRGWVAQEQILATRGLIFGSRELIWQCLCGHSSESNPAQKVKIDKIADLGTPQGETWQTYPAGFDGLGLLRFWINRKDAVPYRPSWQRNNHFDHWYGFISKYSLRDLTFDSDVLPAIAGLASAVGKTHGGSYLEGLWLDDLQTGLAWFVTNKRRNPITPEHRDNASDFQLPMSHWLARFASYVTRGFVIFDELNAPPKTLPPSWSWSSKWGQAIRFRKWENNNRLIEHEGVARMEASIIQSDSQEYTQTATNTLVLKGRMKHGILDYTSRVDLNWRRGNVSGTYDGTDAQYMYNLRDPLSEKVVGHVALDAPPPNSQRLELLYCLLCAAREKYGEWQLTCLGLIPLSGSKSDYRRIGLVFIRETDWFGNLDSTGLKHRELLARTPADGSVMTVRIS